MTDGGFDIRVLDTPSELQQVASLFVQVWGSRTPLVGVELLRAVSHSGGYVAGASRGDQIVGASFGFLARHHGEEALHSHITAVLPGVRHAGLGRATKLHQRAWAADHGLRWVTWTFDPLVRRNAWFNIVVLGADILEYLPDFYGPIDDDINHRDESDRLLVAWATTAEHPAPATAAAADMTAVSTPEDIVVLRRTDPPAARRWRGQVREELGGAMDRGGAVVGFTRNGDYLLR